MKSSPLPQSHRRLTGAFEVAASAFCFGFLGVFGKLAFSSGLKLGELLAFRFLFAAVLLGAGLLIASPRRLKITGRQLFVCSLLGTMGYAVFSSLYFMAIRGVSVALASLLLYTYPTMVAFGAWLVFKEKPTRAQWIALAGTVAGLILLLHGDTEVRSKLALFAGLAAAACYTAYILASSRLQASIDPLTSSLYVICFAAIALFVIHGPSPLRVFDMDLRQLAILFGIALVCTVAPLILFLSGLQKLGNAEASLLSTAEPLTAAIAGGLIFGESLSPLQLLGGALIVGGLALTAVSALGYAARPKAKV